MIFLKFITGIFYLDTPSDWHNVGVVIEEHAVLPNQHSDVHSHGQAALGDKAEGWCRHSSVPWHGCTPKSSFIFRVSFRVSDSRRSKLIHRSKPLASWASEWLDYHHPSPNIYCGLFNSSPPWVWSGWFLWHLHTCTHTRCKTQHFIFYSASWKKLLLYSQKGRYGRPRPAPARAGPPHRQAAAALQPLCAQSTRHGKPIVQFYSLWGTKQLCPCNGANPPARQAEEEGALNPPPLLIPN